MAKEIAAGKRVRVEFCEYRKSNRQYVPVKGLTFFVNVSDIAALRRAHKEMVRALDGGAWKDEDGGERAEA